VGPQACVKHAQGEQKGAANGAAEKDECKGRQGGLTGAEGWQDGAQQQASGRQRPVATCTQTVGSARWATEATTWGGSPWKAGLRSLVSAASRRPGRRRTGDEESKWVSRMFAGLSAVVVAITAYEQACRCVPKLPSAGVWIVGSVPYDNFVNATLAATAALTVVIAVLLLGICERTQKAPAQDGAGEARPYTVSFLRSRLISCELPQAPSM